MKSWNSVVRFAGVTFRWIKNRFTPAGHFLLIVLIISASIGMDTNRSLAYQIFTLAASILAVALLTGLTVKPHFEVDRVLPGSAMTGEPIRYRLTIRNLGSRRYAGLAVFEENSSRNSVLQLPSTVISDLQPLGSSEFNTEVTPLRRGKLNLNAVTVCTPDLLGISRRLQILPAHNSILVLPKRYPVPPVNLSGNRKYQPGGVALSSSIGESLEFDSLRDYRPGDPIRRIHWRSLARTGKLIVKEYQDEYFVRHGLVLDTFPAASNPEIFEEAVSVAASFACSVLTQESLLDLLFVGNEAYTFTAGRGLGGPEKMLEVLACVEPCAHRPFKDLRFNVVSRYNSLSGCICVLLAWDDERREFIRHLQSLRVPVLAVVITDASHESMPEPPPHNVHFLQLGKIAEGLARI